MTILPLICNQVIIESVIHTDEALCYSNPTNKGYIHKAVCHKYTFVNPVDGTQNQAVEYFNNCLKVEMKKRKGVKTEKRDDF